VLGFLLKKIPSKLQLYIILILNMFIAAHTMQINEYGFYKYIHVNPYL